MKTGLENHPNEAVIQVVVGTRATITKIVDHPAPYTPPGDKENPPAASFHIAALILATAEAECWRRGIDPRTLPGIDWTARLS